MKIAYIGNKNFGLKRTVDAEGFEELSREAERVAVISRAGMGRASVPTSPPASVSIISVTGTISPIPIAATTSTT